MDRSADSLEAWIDGELRRPTAPTAVTIAERLRAEFGEAVAAVLFYGSCLREPDFEERIADFYVLVDSYGAVHGRSAMAFLNWLIPPNVYFRAFTVDGITARAKVAVLSLEAFERGAAPSAQLVSIWGRFCQPSRLVYARDDRSAGRVAAAVVQAMRTFAARTGPILETDAASADFWIRGLTECYRTELRAERPDRCQALYEADREYYDALYDRLGIRPGGGGPGAGLAWFARRVLGKAYSVLRLVKAAFTFSGGADYICWKIARHSGVEITLSPWQRRHPVLASTVLFWTLYRKGAFR